MTEKLDETTAKQATDQRFLAAVMAEAAYPAGSEFVRSDLPGLVHVLERNIREHRPTVVVHDDGSEVVIEPPNPGALVSGLLLLAAFLVRGRKRPQVQVDDDIVELPVGARVRWRMPDRVAA